MHRWVVIGRAAAGDARRQAKSSGPVPPPLRRRGRAMGVPATDRRGASGSVRSPEPCGAPPAAARAAWRIALADADPRSPADHGRRLEHGAAGCVRWPPPLVAIAPLDTGRARGPGRECAFPVASAPLPAGRGNVRGRPTGGGGRSWRRRSVRTTVPTARTWPPAAGGLGPGGGTSPPRGTLGWCVPFPVRRGRGLDLRARPRPTVLSFGPAAP